MKSKALTREDWVSILNGALSARLSHHWHSEEHSHVRRELHSSVRNCISNIRRIDARKQGRPRGAYASTAGQCVEEGSPTGA